GHDARLLRTETVRLEWESGGHHPEISWQFSQYRWADHEFVYADRPLSAVKQRVVRASIKGRSLDRPFFFFSKRMERQVAIVLVQERQQSLVVARLQMKYLR